MKTLIPMAFIAIVAARGITRAEATPAAPGMVSRSVTVRFADLNTANVEGAAVLYGRIKKAARNVCEDSSLDLYEHSTRAAEICMRNAIDDAIVKVDRPAVTAYAAAHGALRSEPLVKIARAH
jgi:UrcA family protein